MTSRFSYGRIAHVLLWCGLAVASLVISIPKIYSGVTEFALRPRGPLHTSVSYLKFATGVSGLSKNLISIFQSTNASKRLIIFTRKDDTFSCAFGMTIVYLALPHLVLVSEINGTPPHLDLSKRN